MSSAMTLQEIQFIRSLRRAMAKAGSDVRLVDKLEPIAQPKAPIQTAKSAVVEPLQGYWSAGGSSSFSSSFNGLYSKTAESTLLLEANQLPGPPRGRGVTLNRTDIRVGNTALNLNYTVYADIEFGIGGNLQKVRLDWNDCIVNVPGSVIRITQTMAPMLPETTGLPYNVGSPPEVSGRLGVSICTDPLVSKGYNTYTQGFDLNLVQDPGVLVEVPPYCVGFWMTIPSTTTFAAADSVWVYDVDNPSQQVSPIIGYIPSTQIQANGLSVLNALPPSAQRLRFEFAGAGIFAVAKIIWAIQL